MNTKLGITVLGTGCPAVSTKRYGPANLLQCGGLNLLVDIGSGATQRLVGCGASGAIIDALLITHIHTDHLVDLYQFIISSWHQNRDRKQVIYGPPGIRQLVNSTMEVWEVERNLRIIWEKRSSVAALEIEVHELDTEGVIFEQEGGRVSMVEVEHQPVEPAFGFIFEAAGHKLAVSGDTRYCENLVEAARDADVLVHEVFDHGSMAISGTRTEQGLANVAAYHTASTDVGRVATQAGVGCLVWPRIVPPDANRSNLLAQARADNAGPVIVGEDLMAIDVITRTVQWGDVNFSLPAR
jgi:ribonuclease Z